MSAGSQICTQDLLLEEILKLNQESHHQPYPGRAKISPQSTSSFSCLAVLQFHDFQAHVTSNRGCFSKFDLVVFLIACMISRRSVLLLIRMKSQ